jgi:hypothetical protein
VTRLFAMFGIMDRISAFGRVIARSMIGFAELLTGVWIMDANDVKSSRTLMSNFGNDAIRIDDASGGAKITELP